MTLLAEEAKTPFVFRDAGTESGLLPEIGGIRGHGLAWGDANASGWPDLFVASFHDSGSKPGMFFRNREGKFTSETPKELQTSGMGSGALFVDLNNRGKLDLYVSTCATNAKVEVRKVPSYLFRNDGNGKFTDITKESGIALPLFAGRGLAALDADGDGLLDLLLCERYYGKVEHGPVLFRNRGDYRFENRSRDAGLPEKLSGLGLAVADLNRDGWPDLFLSEGEGNHRLYLNDKTGKFTEVPSAREVFAWKNLGKEDTPAGVCIGDVNRDGWPDILIGQHFKAPWKSPVPLRLYLHRGLKEGLPIFEEVTAKVGLNPIAMKAPHVEIQDFDNDGWPDLYTSVVKFKDGQPHPLIYRNLGIKDGLPQFEEQVWKLNDFPTADDLAARNSTALFDKILKEKKIIYMAASSSCDYNRDGKLDLLLLNWWVESPSLLLKNESPGGHWLDVRVEGSKGVNRMGIGAVVNVYSAGKLGQREALLGSREIAIGYGFCSGQEAIAHFGLGETTRVDLEVILPHGKGRLTRTDVKADQLSVISDR
jgi:hypothetical protein